jgi:hypothetical protein
MTSVNIHHDPHIMKQKKIEPTPTEKFESHYSVKIMKNKKSRTVAEDLMMGALYWLIEYKNIGRAYPEETRYASSIEASLVIEGKLDLYKPLEPNVTEEKFLWFTSKITESYREMMIRLGLEYLKEKEVIG